MRIGDFARLGQVSVRMLRHYDQLRLLRPDHVDPWSGHRSYGPDQLARLNRVVALKELGLTLDQVGQVLTDRVSAEELRGMLRLRYAELADEVERTRIRLAGIEHRLRLIEREDTMSSIECVIKQVPATRIVARSTEVAGQPEIAAAIGPLYEQVAAVVSAAGGCPETGVALYDATESGLSVTAGFLYDGPSLDGVEDLPLPAVTAATTVHLGTMEHIATSWAGLMQWCEANGWEPSGVCREVYVEAPGTDPSPDWVTELQQPVVRSASDG